MNIILLLFFCQELRVKEGAQGHQALPVVQDPPDNLVSKVSRVLQVLLAQLVQLEVRVNRVKRVHEETLVLQERFLAQRVQSVTLDRLVSKDLQEALGARVQRVLLVSPGCKDLLVSKVEQVQRVGDINDSSVDKLDKTR